VASEQEVKLPNIGDFEDVEVIELLVKPGDRIEIEQALLVLESDKATMEIPSPVAGTLKKLLVGVGDKVSEGKPIALIDTEQQTATQTPKQEAPTGGRASGAAEGGVARSEPKASEADKDGRTATSAASTAAEDAGPLKPTEAKKPAASTPARRTASPRPEQEPEREPEAEPTPTDLAPYSTAGAAVKAHASPSVRRLARELGVELDLVPGSGPKGRIRPEDVQGYVKALVSQRGAAAVPIAGVHVAAPVEIDFAKWGPVESEPLNRVRRVAAANLHRSWVTVPHVTQHDEADVTDLEAFREEHRAEAEARGVKLTFLPFVVKAAVKALREFPHFNASLDHTGEHLVVKRYYHIGVAVDTEHGLVVPVVRDADRKGLYELAAELQDLSARARERKLRPEHLQGGSFSISSLGGIGGSFFTPIVNHPEVAILGVSRTQWRPLWRDDGFVPRRVLPLSLSYDHRVIDGADAARFTTRLAALLGDLRRVLL
jgi:pyruvate dehydrogenase E2 component (dihydrolipoamide acetyltransferase)